MTEQSSLHPAVGSDLELAVLARDYVRLDREINFHLRCTAAGEGVHGEYLRLCTERESVVTAMAEVVDREAARVIRDADADFVAQAVNDYGAFLGIVEAAQDFLASVYPCGTAHPADAEADRLRRAIERLT